jgi:hypothetical protein
MGRPVQRTANRNSEHSAAVALCRLPSFQTLWPPFSEAGHNPPLENRPIRPKSARTRRAHFPISRQARMPGSSSSSATSPPAALPSGTATGSGTAPPRGGDGDITSVAQDTSPLEQHHSAHGDGQGGNHAGADTGDGHGGGDTHPDDGQGDHAHPDDGQGGSGAHADDGQGSSGDGAHGGDASASSLSLGITSPTETPALPSATSPLFPGRQLSPAVWTRSCVWQHAAGKP